MPLGILNNSVYPELVEGLPFWTPQPTGQGFDKLSLNGFGSMFL